MGRLNRCPDARALLPEYVEGELSPLESRRLEGHLSLCAACRQEETEYRTAFGALHAPRPLAPHGDLYSGFAAKLDRAGLGAPRRQMPLRWAAASVLVLAVAGASASYFRGAFAPVQSPAHPTVAEAVRPKAAGPHPTTPARKTFAKAEPEVKPEVKFEWKSDPPPSDTKTDSPAAVPDPFDAKRVAQDSVRDETPRETTREPRRPRRPQVAVNEKKDFFGVKPIQGPSAEEIIIQKRREVTVAQYGAPQPMDDLAHVANDHAQPVRPFIVATDPESKSAAPSSAVAPVSMAPSDETEVMVNGKPADVRTAVGYDKRGRPVLVKMNIAVKPERSDRTKEHPDK